MRIGLTPVRKRKAGGPLASRLETQFCCFSLGHGAELRCGAQTVFGSRLTNHSNTGEATKTELYVPTITPTTKEKAKAWIPEPPKK